MRGTSRCPGIEPLALELSRPYCQRVPRFRLEFVDDGSSVEVEADDFDDDGEEISLYRYVPYGADPLDPNTTKEVLASFARTSLAGPPHPIA